MFGAVLLVFKPFDLEDQRHSVGQTNQEVRLVAVLDALVLVGDDESQVVVAGVESDCLSDLLLQAGRGALLPGCGVGDDLIDMTASRAPTGSRGFEIDCGCRADGLVPVQHGKERRFSLPVVGNDRTRQPLHHSHDMLFESGLAFVAIFEVHLARPYSSRNRNTCGNN